MAASMPLYRRHWRKAAAAILPCALVTLGYAALIFAANTNHLHLNDGTSEGLEAPSARAFSVQYHPEAAAGPHDALYLFERFVRAMERG